LRNHVYNSHSIDLRIQAGGENRPALDLQLKATTNSSENEDDFLRCQLSIKNYRDLYVQTQTPRLLVVLELPEDEPQWMTIADEELVLRHRAYWFSLQRDHEDVTVHIPKDNILNVGTIQNLIEKSRMGEI